MIKKVRDKISVSVFSNSISHYEASGGAGETQFSSTVRSGGNISLSVLHHVVFVVVLDKTDPALYPS